MHKKFLLLAMFLPAVIFAQNNEKETQTIVITKKGAGSEKLNIVVDGEDITVNGKPAAEQDDVTVKKMRIKDPENFVWSPAGPGQISNGNIIFNMPKPNKAMLGVISKENDQGAEITSVPNESAAKKAGLKTGDIITHVDGEKIETPDELSKSLKDKNPGDEVKIGYIRDQKSYTAIVTLTAWKAPQATMYNGNSNWSFDMPDMNEIAKGFSKNWNNDRINQFYRGQSFANAGPKLGIHIQDMEKGSGAKIMNVEEGSNADNAGLQEGDIIKEINGNKVDDAEQITAAVRKNAGKSPLKITVERKGRLQNVNVNFSKKIKNAHL